MWDEDVLCKGKPTNRSSLFCFFLPFFYPLMSSVDLEKSVLACWCRPDCVPALRTGWSSGRTETTEIEDAKNIKEGKKGSQNFSIKVSH